MAFDELRSAIAKLEADIARGPIVPSVTPLEIRGYLASRYDFTKPLALDDVSADVERMLRTWQVQVTHPRYFGLFNPSVTLASIVGDTLVAMYNPQLATWRTSPAANEIERHTLAWLAGKFGFAADAVASFTNGGAEANLSAVVVALTRAFPEYGEQGLRGLSASPTIYVTAEAHHSFNKIAHMTGLGRRALRRVATDGQLRMDLGDLARRVAEDRQGGLAPLLVVGTVGTTAAGAIDPLPELAGFWRAERGEAGDVAMIEHQARTGEVLREALRRAGWRVVNTTPLPLVCFTRDGLDPAQFLAALYQRQIAWMSEVRLGGGAPVVRACITSFRTTEADIEWVVREMDRLIEVTT